MELGLWLGSVDRISCGLSSLLCFSAIDSSECDSIYPIIPNDTGHHKNDTKTGPQLKFQAAAHPLKG